MDAFLGITQVGSTSTRRSLTLDTGAIQNFLVLINETFVYRFLEIARYEPKRRYSKRHGINFRAVYLRA